MLQQMDDFSFKHSGQIDDLYTQYTADQIKAFFDSRGIELRTALNALIQALNATTGASNIGATAPSGLAGATIQDLINSLLSYVQTNYNSKTDFQTLTVGASGGSKINVPQLTPASGTTVESQLAYLLQQIGNTALGSVPDGSVTLLKLATDATNKINASLNQIGAVTDASGNITNLNTIDKTKLVNAINEILGDLNSHLSEKASQGQLGHVEVDGTSITVDENGIISLKVKNNFSASATPTATDDSSKKYSIGSLWYYNKIIYLCIDNTVNSAKWVKQFNAGNDVFYDSSLADVVKNEIPDITGGWIFTNGTNYITKNTNSLVVGSGSNIPCGISTVKTLDLSRFTQIKIDWSVTGSNAYPRLEILSPDLNTLISQLYPGNTSGFAMRTDILNISNINNGRLRIYSDNDHASCTVTVHKIYAV